MVFFLAPKSGYKVDGGSEENYSASGYGTGIGKDYAKVGFNSGSEHGITSKALASNRHKYALGMQISNLCSIYRIHAIAKQHPSQHYRL